MRHDIYTFLCDFLTNFSPSFYENSVLFLMSLLHILHTFLFQLSFTMIMKWQIWFMYQKLWYMVAAWIQSLRPIPTAVAAQDRLVCNFWNVTGGYMENTLFVWNNSIKFWKKKIHWPRI